jgi:hypothetical protein
MDGEANPIDPAAREPRIVELVRWTLEHHAAGIDADTIASRYGAGPPFLQAERCMQSATRRAATIGATSGAAVSAVELLDIATLGASAALVVPVIGADLAATLRIQLCAAYDLALIHGAPLSLDDPDDCHVALISALGAKPSHEAAGEPGSFVPMTLAYGVRKALRSGLQKTLVIALHRAASPWLAQRVTERVVLGLLPGVNIPLTAGINAYFTRRVVRRADAQMRRRAAIAQPMRQLVELGVSRLAILGAVASTLSAPDRAGRSGAWTDAELGTLQMAVACARISDADAATLDASLDRDPHAIGDELALDGEARTELRELLVTVAAIAAWGDDAAYARTIAAIARGDAAVIASEIVDRRAGL